MESFVATKKQDDQQQDDQPGSNEQSGSTGRHTGKEVLEKDKDTGQGRYGQSGFAGNVNRETIGQQKFKQSPPGGDEKLEPDSNHGSGTDVDESEKGKVGPEKAKLTPRRFV